MPPRLQIVHEQFPGLPAKALDFFGPANMTRKGSTLKPRTVMEFADHIAKPGITPNSREHPPFHRINLILQRMADLNLLIVMNRGGFAGCDASYICDLDDEQKSGVQSTLDYVIYGFPVIYEDLRHSVIPIIHSGATCDQIGTSFLRTRYVLLTAAHCVDKAEALSIRGISASQFRQARIAVHKNSALDLAAIYFAEPILPGIKEIELGKGSVLDDVLVLGYPNVPGFTELLAVEKAAVSARITVTSGAIASSATEIFAKASMFLITARVRGGFSGGPVINGSGLAVGLISRQPISCEGEGASLYAHYDNLGYGVAIPTEEIIAFLTACQNQDVETVDFKSGATILYRECRE